jgi:SAM-dependent methyltransferase
MDTKIASGFYNSIEPECGEERGFVVDRVRPQLARAIKPGTRVLDLGCGAGRFTFAAEDMGAIPVGIDCASVLLAHGRRVAEQRGSCAHFVEGDYSALPFAPESFDVALLMCNIVECSYHDVDSLLAQLRVILVRDGILCFDMPDYLAQHQQNGRSLMEYDPCTGRKESISEIPGRGKFPVQSYFWTAAFAKHVCSRHLALHEDEPLSGGRHWLAFRNST